MPNADDSHRTGSACSECRRFNVRVRTTGTQPTDSHPVTQPSTSGPDAMLPAAATPWVLPLPGLPPQFTVTMQGAVYDSSSPFALSITNALILRVP